MVEAHDRFLGAHRFSALDGLRALSVLAVIWHHTAGQVLGGVVNRGWLGVDMFFAISGFLITTLLLRERSRTGKISLRKFYVRRTLRIFPVYYLVLSAYVVLVLTTRAGTPEGEQFLRNLPAFATYTSNWFVDLGSGTSVTFYFTWSLATEEQFYLFWPPLLALLLAWRGGRVLVPVAALSMLSMLRLVVEHTARDDLLIWRILGSLAVPILLGAAAALILHSRRGFMALGPALIHRAAAPALAAVLLALTAAGTRTELVQVTMVLLVAAVCVRENTLLHPVLTLKPLVFVGAISYGMYLMHMLAANLVRPVIGAEYGWPVFLATVPVVTVAAYLSFHFFERPILRLKRRFEVVQESSVDGRQPDRESA